MNARPAKRPKFIQRIFRVSGSAVQDRVLAAIHHMPIDQARPLEVIIREIPSKRHSAQNSYYWMRISEIAYQAWFDGRQYSPEVLHEYLKRQLLPEDLPEPEPGMVADAYRKWEFDPSGERVLVGSTTMLTIKGFAEYVQQVEAFGASLGVQFSADLAP